MSIFATPQTDDGWSDAAAENTERVIKGTLLKFADGNWSRGKEGTKVELGARLVAFDTAAAWVKWFDGKPLEYRLRQPGHRLPEREELGDLDEGRWDMGPDGKPKDPWQNTRFVYLIHPVSGEEFTFSTSSWGGRCAVSDLAEEIQRTREGRPGVVPLVELCAAPMLTRFGKRSKPLFRVVDWRTNGCDQANDVTPGVENKGNRPANPQDGLFAQHGQNLRGQIFPRFRSAPAAKSHLDRLK
jgi:hypothetical protein